MRLEHYSSKQLKQEILAIASKYLDLSKYKIFFFGSRVAETGTKRSDIDVGIKGRKPVPAVSLVKMEEELEQLPILYKIEIVDFTQVSQKFKNVALEKIETIN